MGSSVNLLLGAGVMWTLSLLVSGTIISSATGSRVIDDEDPTSRFNHYDEMMYNDYEGQDTGGEWNSYSPVSNDMYMGGDSNGPQQKFGHSSLHDGPDNPFDDPFFSNFLKGQEPGKLQQQAQPQRPHQQQQPIRPPQPQQQQQQLPPPRLQPKPPSQPVRQVKPAPQKQIKPQQQAVKQQQKPSQQQQITVVKKTKKPVIATSEKQKQSKKIREFTLMISKLLFQLSQMQQ